MSYVIANTGNPLGRRALGRGLGRMGWDNIPYPRNPLSRSVEVLNGEFNPAGADPSTNTHGAVTYRIDPRTGQYIFSRTDIKPRGPFMQNTFQHPAPTVITPLGVRALPIGASVTASTMQRGRTSRGPMISMRPGIQLSGMGCDCGGRCNAPLSGPRFNLRRRSNRRRLGADPNQDTFVDSNTGCIVDTDGNLLTCPSGPGGTQQPTKTGPTDPALLQQLISAGQSGQQIALSLTPRTQVAAPLAESWWFQKTSIGGMMVPNPLLASGAVGFAFLLAGMGGKRR